MKFKKIDIVVVGATITVNLILIIAFLHQGKYTGCFQFQLMTNQKTGEPLSVLSSCVVYAFIAFIAYPLFSAIICAVVVEPIVYINCLIARLPITRYSEIPGFDIGYSSACISSFVSVSIIGFLYVFGIVTI